MKWRWLLAGMTASAVLPVAIFSMLLAAITIDDATGTLCTTTTPAEADPACASPQFQAMPGPIAALTNPDAMVSDPTSKGRITQRMLSFYLNAQQTFGDWPWGAACWSLHAWNPTSDHPQGRACDFTVGHLGQRPTSYENKVGWELARWAQDSASTTGVSYVIWSGRIWSVTRAREGWRPYDGAGIYNPLSVTGGHYDHIHVSVR